MDSEPRNFSGSYPLAGERIGPAWRKVWAVLSHRHWMDFSSVVKYANADVAEGTIRGLLSRAHRAGQVEVQYRMERSRKRAFYRGKASS